MSSTEELNPIELKISNPVDVAKNTLAVTFAERLDSPHAKLKDGCPRYDTKQYLMGFSFEDTL